MAILIYELRFTSAQEFKEFVYLSSSVQELLIQKSFKAPVAYIETDYFGGIGSQAAILFDKQKVKLGPLQSQKPGAINSILKSLGVINRSDKDEFDTLGLGNYRHFDDLEK